MVLIRWPTLHPNCYLCKPHVPCCAACELTHNTSNDRFEVLCATDVAEFQATASHVGAGVGSFRGAVAPVAGRVAAAVAQARERLETANANVRTRARLCERVRFLLGLGRRTSTTVQNVHVLGGLRLPMRACLCEGRPWPAVIWRTSASPGRCVPSCDPSAVRPCRGPWTRCGRVVRCAQSGCTAPSATTPC
jgi:hypothetical protein